jgi:uncharacterized membrane protein (DUF2068 family)
MAETLKAEVQVATTPMSVPAGIARPVTVRCPTLYGIILFKLLKGIAFVVVAVAVYTLSDNDLPAEYQQLLHHLRVNPEKKFWSDLAVQVGNLTEARVMLVALGTLVYSLFSLVEGVGLMFRVRWAGWMAIGESAFFIPIEVFELAKHFTKPVALILVLNIIIVWYLYQNRARLFHGRGSGKGTRR